MEIKIKIEKKILDIIRKFSKQAENNTLDLAPPGPAVKTITSAPRRRSAKPSLPNPGSGGSTGGGGGY